ncbi:MAG: aldo/keto reductase [Ruminiclostridium sp.]|nr:aldo/keto reductase [Ruminiclostridium sp.]
MTLQDTCTLRNGVNIPRLGFGTYKTPEGEVAEASVLAALEAGYRHIDTAAFYGNEVSVGRAIRKSGIPREEIFVTTKVWNTERGYEKARASILASLERLGLGYVDLCLVHWPAIPKQFDNWEEINLDTWRAFTELHRMGKIRAIGVSNFKPRHLKALMETEVKPMVNQIECHPGQPQNETFAYCQNNGILVEAWSPMGRGKLLDHHLLTEMAAKYGVSVAQLCIRWCLQREIIPLPKSVTPDRIRENARVYDFAISQEDMAVLTGMPPTATSHDPDEIDF